MAPLDAALAGRFAATACAALEREYPNHLTHFLNGSEDNRPPRELHPAFFGALDWHSAVHNHWLLVRLAIRFPAAAFAVRAHELLERHLTADNIARECAYFEASGREGFERPYGWAWLLALDGQLAARPVQRAALAPLVALIAGRIAPWLDALPYPVRSGEHANTAFALGLIRDWAGAAANDEIVAAVDAAAQRFYGADRGASFAFEPSGHDFLSPILCEADLMARVLAANALAEWLDGFLNDEELRRLVPAAVPASEDYKLAHLAGLNLSRAWMLAAIGERLPTGHRRQSLLQNAATAHAEAGLATALRQDYGASHWLPTFAVHLLAVKW